MNRPVITIALVLAASSGVSNQSRLPRAPGTNLVTITPPGQSGSEPAIAINPKNPNQVVGAAGGRWAAYSTDGGRTFTPVQPGGEEGRAGGDVSLAFDDKGSVFLSFLSIEKNGLPSYWGHGPGANGIWVRRSPDGGRTWDKDAIAVKMWKGDEPDIKLEDMPRIWADTQPASPHRGNLYIAWIEWQIDKSIARSSDDGKTWTSPQRVNDDPLHDGADQFLQWMAVDPTDGAVYVQFYDRRDDPANRRTLVTLARSGDGGRTFVNYRWSDEPFEGENAFLGDYEWLTAYGGHAYGIWAEGVREDPESAPRAQATRRPAAPHTQTIVIVGTADFTAIRSAHPIG